ncbi:hypothetical protein JOC95_001988 [Bacillus tianshenii]|uniref:Uncharacterized protein n=1 Tax=Sutcliffiella tianshenii TaxID=1463404 RepID=A0ABS2P125_9BACI|nr:hypothetical protein [Bacillus tianshenii]MBM7620135.1 hypothetical protein [Bacillus tianshenii]
MPKKKIHIMIILALFINAMAMLLFAIDNIQLNNLGPGITFTLLTIVLFSFGVYSIVRNKKIKEAAKR